MNKTLKKTLSIILTILMIVTSVPLAFATDEITVQAKWGSDVNNLTGEGTLQEVMDLHDDGTPIGYIQLQSDIDTATALDRGYWHFYYDQVTTLDLNGYTVTGTSYTISIYAGDLTVTDTSAEGTGKILSEASGAAAILMSAYDGGASLTVEKGTLEGSRGISTYSWCADSSITVKGGTIKGSSYAIDMGGDGSNTLTLNDGEFISGSNATIDIGDSVIINGGTFTGVGRRGHFELQSSGTLDLRNYDNALGKKIYINLEAVDSASGVIQLPDGYVFVDKDKNQAETLKRAITYTVWKIHECAGEEQNCIGYKCDFCGEYFGEGSGLHTGETQYCIGYKCDVCGEYFGEGSGIHTGETQYCIGYKCDICGAYFGEGSGAHSDAEDSNGLCDNDDCKFFMGSEIKVGESYTVTKKEYVKFVPQVSGNFIIRSVSEVDPRLQVYNTDFECVADADDSIYRDENSSDFYLDYYSFTAGETYYIDFHDYNGTYNYTVYVECGTAHQGGTATCTVKAVCEICGKEYGELLTHDWSNGDSVCAVCGTPCEHDWSNEDGVCANGCGTICAHESYTDGICDVCGCACPHESYTDGICDVCRCACTHESYVDSKCEACGYACTHESYTDGICDVCSCACAHESYVDSKCEVCGCPCPHNNFADGRCDDCGAEGTLVVITMSDSYDDGWNGNAIKIEQIIDGVHTEIATVTIEAGASETFTIVLPEEGSYAFSWVKGNYSDECSFTVEVNGETVCEATDGSKLDDGKVVYVICEHDFEESVCTNCKLECGVDFEHEVTDYTCTVCGKYIYAIIHQPTAAEPYVETNDSDATYQWYTVEDGTTEITDKNGEAYSYGGETATYDNESGWTSIYDEDGYYSSVTIELNAGDTVILEFEESGFEYVGLWDFENSYECAYAGEENGVTKYELTADSYGNYTVYTEAPINFKIYLGEAATYTKIEGETSAELANPEIGKKYACEVTFADKTTEKTDAFKYTYAITHQPTAEEPYVELNDDTDASYQWYTVEGDGVEITDENAFSDWQSLGAPFNNSVYEDGKWIADTYDNLQYYFIVDLEAGDTINFEFASEVEGIIFGIDGDFSGQFEVGDTKYSITVEEAGSYWLVTLPVDYVRATIGNVEYTPVEGQTTATLFPTELGLHACEVTFADGTKEMSDIFEVTKLHDCDFSGEWKYDSEKHWKECTVDGCSKISEEAEHSFTDGNCACGYTCPHENYTDGVCNNCKYECPHEWGEGVLTRPTLVYDDGLDVLKEGYYTYICELCGDEKTETVESADTVLCDELFMQVFNYSLDETLTEEARDEIEQRYQNFMNNNGEVLDQFGLIRYDLIASEQGIVDEAVAELQEIIDDIEAKIASGEYVKADYTEIDEAIAEIEEKLDDENVTDEGKAGLEEIKAQLEEMKADENTSAADLAELEKALEDYETALDEGIEDGTLVEVDGKLNEIVSEIIQKWSEKLEAEGLTDEYEDFINNNKATDEALAAEKEIADFAYSLEGTVADNAENLAKLEEMLNSLLAELENCLRGTHNFNNYEITTPAKCEVNAKETGTCWLCGETDEREVANSALTHSFTEYEELIAPECGKKGFEVAKCDNGCGAEDDRDIPALEHVDEDGDCKCDYGCGHEFEAEHECYHICHNNNVFLRIAWKIVNVFLKLFNIHPVCKCGVAHY